MNRRALFLATVAAATATALAAPAQTNSFNNDSGNVCTAIGNGATVTCEFSGRVDFTQDVADALLQHMPDKSKPVNLVTVGGETDQQIGAKVQSYLTGKGYTVRRAGIMMLVPPPEHPFTLQVGGKEYDLQVAPSAH